MNFFEMFDINKKADKKAKIVVDELVNTNEKSNAEVNKKPNAIKNKVVHN